MCDFILFYKNKKEQVFVVLCNLKSEQNGSNTKQMKAAEVFTDFIIKTIARLYEHQNTDFNLIKVNYRSNKGAKKNATNARKIAIKNEYGYESNSKNVEICNLSKICRLQNLS
jgi:hypothetical protein